MDVYAIQKQLAAMSLDGWLLYDFHGQNEIALHVAELEGHVTRRWFCLIPDRGEPRWLVSSLDRGAFSDVAGEVTTYFSWQTLRDGLHDLLPDRGRVAMEYVPDGAVPYVSKVDAGTIELVRSTGVTVVSSADIVQWFEARLSAAALSYHLEAARHLQAAMERAFHLIGQSARARRRITEYDVQQEIVRYFEQHDMVTDHPPIVAATMNTRNPHYAPVQGHSALVEEGDLVLVDMWAKMNAPEAVYADITWMAYVGDQVPDDFSRVFSVVARARDEAIRFIRAAVEARSEVRGYEVDDAARAVISAHGYSGKFIHRTGHSLGREVHGPGVNFDNLETHDERLLIPDIAATVEPGVYLTPFGMRTEVDVYVGDGQMDVTTTPIQKHIVPLLDD